MKITKRQLRRIIREEKSKLLNENRLVGSIGFGSNAERQEHLKNSGQKSINEEEKAKLKEYGSDGSPVYSASAEEELVDTIERIEEIIGEDGVRLVLSKMGYGEY